MSTPCFHGKGVAHRRYDSDWIVGHPLVLPPAKLQALVTDQNDDGPLKEILTHPEVVAAFEQARERKEGGRA